MTSARACRMRSGDTEESPWGYVFSVVHDPSRSSWSREWVLPLVYGAWNTTTFVLSGNCPPVIAADISSMSSTSAPLLPRELLAAMYITTVRSACSCVGRAGSGTSRHDGSTMARIRDSSIAGMECLIKTLYKSS